MRPKPISDSELGELIHQEIYQSDNRSGSEMQQNTERAYDYFLYRDKGDEVEGRNTIQSGDVADAIDHILAELQSMYSVDNLVKIESENSSDRSSGEETEAINWYFRERLRGFEVLDNACQAGLLMRNGYLKIWPEEGYKLPYDETIAGTEEQIQAHLNNYPHGWRVEVKETTVVEEAQVNQIVGVGPDGVTPIETEVVVSPTIIQVEIRVIPWKREILAAAVAREDMYLSRDADSQNMQKPRFVAERRWITRSHAVSLGFDETEIYDLPAISYVEQQTKTARMADVQRLQTRAPSQDGDVIQIWEVYYLVDRDGDGIAERHKCFWGNRKVLHWNEDLGGELCDEVVRYVPYSSGTPLTVAFRHAGRSIFDKLKAIEDASRTLMRQGLDNIEMANNRRPLLGPGVSEEDVEETEIGAYIRCDQGVDQYGEAGFTPVFDKTLLGLEYLEKKRAERVGGSISTSGSAIPTNVAAHTFERFISSQEDMVRMYARNFANTLIRDAFVLLHQQLRVLGDDFEYESDGEWKVVQPRYWVERERITVTLGNSAGEKLRLAAAYDGLMDRQAAVAQAGYGGTLVNEENFYAAAMGQANLLGLPDPDQYWTDPQGLEAQQARQAKQQSQERAQELQRLQIESLAQAEMQRTALQEETKRLSDLSATQQKTLDRLAKFVTEMTKIEADTGEDVRGGILYGDEEQRIPQ